MAQKRIKIDKDFIKTWNEDYDRMKEQGILDKIDIDVDRLYEECFGRLYA